MKVDGAPEEMSADVPKYAPTDTEYLGWLQQRLIRARSQKQQPYPEFNGRNYYQDYESNEKIANTFLPEKRNDDDVVISAGTIETKLDIVLAALNNLNLEMELMAFDKEDNRLHQLGIAIQDAVQTSEEYDGGLDTGDGEKKMLRQRELLKQNVVIVQDEWLRKFKMEKVLKEKYEGQFSDFKGWDASYELIFEGPNRELIYGPNFFPGNITEYFMENQPYIFFVSHMDYKVAEMKYGKFENWKYVKPGAVPPDVNEDRRTIYDNKWRLTEVKANQVEIIIYEDQPRNEFNIIINGVLMCPIGFPLSAVSPEGKYNVVKQVFRPYNHKFFYGKAFVASAGIKEVAAMIDEFYRLFILKTRKSVTPAYINTSGKVISSKVLSPGRISMGIPPDALQAIGQEGQGVTSNEFSVLKELQDRIDRSTVSPQFAGQQGKSGTTATEVNELMRQSKLTMGLIVASASYLEMKLAYLRINILLENWFKPIGTRVADVDGVRKEINMYRTSKRKTQIDGQGLGMREVIPVDNGEQMPTPEVIRAQEHMDEAKLGMPVQKLYLDADGLSKFRGRWYVTISAKEREGSMVDKLAFREELNDVLTLMQFGSQPNTGGLEEKFSRVWNEQPGKVFAQGSPAGMQGAVPPVGGQGNAPGIPKLPQVGVASGAGVGA